MILTAGDSWFSYPLNANFADYVARYLVDEAHARLTALASTRQRFHVVDMRSALPADDVHWADEIHPSGTGLRRLAEDHWRPLLQARFPGRGFE